MGNAISNLKPGLSYGSLLRVDNGNLGIDGTARTVTDGLGNDSALLMSTSTVQVKNSGVLDASLAASVKLPATWLIAGTAVTPSGTQLNKVATIVTQGTRDKHFAAHEFYPVNTGNPAQKTTSGGGSNKAVSASINYDRATQEYAWTHWKIPKSFKTSGNVQFDVTWLPDAGASAGEGVVFDFQFYLVRDNVAIDGTMSSLASVTDTCLNAGSANKMQVTPLTTAVTISGITKEDTLYIGLSRQVAAAADTMSADAVVHNVRMKYEIDAETDA